MAESDAPVPFSGLKPVAAKPAPMSAADRLRAFEDKHLPKESADHPRPGGKIERGHGSHFAALHPKHKATHAALEGLVAAEAEHQAASAADDAAHAKLEAAIKRVEAAEAASEKE